MDKERPQTKEEVLASSKPEKPEEKEKTLSDILRDKFRRYKLEVPSEEPGPEEVVLKRWTYGISSELMPMTTEILSSVVSRITPLMNQTQEASGSFLDLSDIAAILDDKSLGGMFSRHMKDVTKILARTLNSAKENNLDLGKAMSFVSGMDPYDVIQLSKILYAQNFSHLLKNAGWLVPAKVSESKNGASQ